MVNTYGYTHMYEEKFLLVGDLAARPMNHPKMFNKFLKIMTPQDATRRHNRTQWDIMGIYRK